MVNLQTSGLRNGATMAENATTGAWISTTLAIPGYLNRPRIPDLQNNIMLHNLDGTTATTITTTTTPDTLTFELGLISAPLERTLNPGRMSISLLSHAAEFRVATAQTPPTQRTYTSNSGVFTTPELDINLTLQHTYADGAEAYMGASPSGLIRISNIRRATTRSTPLARNSIP